MKVNVIIVLILLIVSSSAFGISTEDNEELKTIKIRLDKLNEKIKVLNNNLNISSRLELKKKIELLKTEIEKLKIELLDNNPYATGETLNWGKGFNFWLGYSAEKQASIEVNYSFNIKRLKGKKSILNKSGGLILGIGLGFTDFEDERINIDFDNYSKNISFSSSGNIFYSKLSLSSPVLLTFINTSISLRLLYINPSENSMNITRNRFGVGLDFDINFWLSKKVSITVGYKSDIDFGKNNILDGLYEDKVLSENFKFQLGTKYYF